MRARYSGTLFRSWARWLPVWGTAWALATAVGVISIAAAQGTPFDDSLLVFSPLTVIQSRAAERGPAFQALVVGQTRRDDVRASLGEPTETQGNEDTWRLTTVCHRFDLSRMMARYGEDGALTQLMFEMIRAEPLAEVCAKLRLLPPFTTQQGPQGEIRVYRSACVAIAVHGEAVTALWLLAPAEEHKPETPAEPAPPAANSAEDQALLQAVRSGDVAQVKALLARGANLQMQDERGRTPLHWAVTARRHDLVELLLDGGAPPGASAKDGTTPLHLAAIAGDEQLVGLLLARGALPTARDHDGDTAADVARTEPVRRLIADAIAERAASPEGAAARECVTAYFEALRNGDAEALARLSTEGTTPESLAGKPAALTYEIRSVEAADDAGQARVQITLDGVPAPLDELTADLILARQAETWRVASVRIRPAILEGRP